MFQQQPRQEQEQATSGLEVDYMADSKKYDGSQWEHSLRKLTTATETIQSGDTIYANGQPITTYNIKGNEEHTGTPSPQNPVMPNGVGNKTANLFDVNGETDTIATSVTIINNAIKFENVPSGNTARITYSAQYAAGTYYISCVASGSNYSGVRLFSDSSFTGATYNSFYGGYYRDFALRGFSTSLTFDNDFKIGFIANAAGGATFTIYDMMLSTTQAAYEPYGYKIPILSGQTALNPIYLTEPLMKIGDTVDSLASSGTATYNIGWIDLGTLDWEVTQSGNFHSTTIISDMKMITNNDTGNAVCTEFSEVDALSVANVAYSFSSCLNNQRTPFVNKTGFEGMTAAQFKAAMSGVIMYYVKAEATTETITAPSIPTTEGANSITVDTTVQPSEFTATWTGWHDASVQEYVGGAGNQKFDYTTMASGITGYYLSSAGVETESNAWAITDYIPCNGQSFTLGKIGGNAPAICLYDSNKTFIAGQAYNTGGADFKNDITVTASQNAKYIRFSYFIASPAVDLSTIMLNEGTTALPYEPYEYGWA